MHRSFVTTRHGQIHLVEEGSGPAVLLLHQTPRSWDEYREVIPLLADRYRVIAPDTLGFGASEVPVDPWSVDMFADGVGDLVDELGLERFALVGHHTGGVVAMEVAARLPHRVDALVLSGVPFVDSPRRQLVASRPTIDGVEISDDGSHYQRLFDKRRAFYPQDRPDLLRRLVADAVRVGERVEEGHEAVNAYRMEDRVGLVQAPTLLVCGELDTFSLPDVPKLAAAISDTREQVLAGTGVASVDHDPDQFAEVVGHFLDTVLERTAAR